VGPKIRRGHVCMIGNCKEFFIATADHPEWNVAHTIWGEVDDMQAVDSLLLEPYTNFTHPEFGTVMRMMDKRVPFQISTESHAFTA
jgi:cyclophilin family peptidyl-prolyl cis-trans isomerase